MDNKEAIKQIWYQWERDEHTKAIEMLLMVVKDQQVSIEVLEKQVQGLSANINKLDSRTGSMQTVGGVHSQLKAEEYEQYNSKKEDKGADTTT